MCVPTILFRYTGMLEAVRVRREGFSYRPFFSDFFNCYRAVAYYFTDTVGNLCNLCSAVVVTNTVGNLSNLCSAVVVTDMVGSE